MAPSPLIPKRDDWHIHIRYDLGEPVMQFHSEWSITMPNASRHVVDGIPHLEDTLTNLDDIPITLENNVKTTLGAIVRGLKALHSDAIDQHEADGFSRDKPERKTIREKLAKHPNYAAEIKQVDLAKASNKA